MNGMKFARLKDTYGTGVFTTTIGVTVEVGVGVGSENKTRQPYITRATRITVAIKPNPT
jgi:hypothetical protein